MMIKKKYQVLKSGILRLNGGEIAVSIHENTYGDQWFATQAQFDEQVASGLIVEIDTIPT